MNEFSKVSEVMIYGGLICLVGGGEESVNCTTSYT